MAFAFSNIGCFYGSKLVQIWLMPTQVMRAAGPVCDEHRQRMRRGQMNLHRDQSQLGSTVAITREDHA
jgi:hypothetical protein